MQESPIRQVGVSEKDSRPLIAHVVYRFDTGGLENGVVNLINNLPADKYRHAVIALTDITDFRLRILRDDVTFIALNKGPGQGIWQYPKLYRIFRQLKPAVVHTRNLAALEATVPAWVARVPVRLHSEHGREGSDLGAKASKYTFLRRLYRPFVSYYLALSQDLRDYLTGIIRIPANRVAQIYNGVDADRFHVSSGGRSVVECPFADGGRWLVGTVGRMQPVKDQLTLARAFVYALAARPDLRERLRLILVGDGPLRKSVEEVLAQAGCLAQAWLPGERHDIPEVLRGLDCFVLPSISEGISNTILEAMATGLPVIATNTGGNGELVTDGVTGQLVPVGNPEAMAAAIIRYADDARLARAAGMAGRAAVELRFSMEAMVASYAALYDRLMAEANAPLGGLR